MIPGRCNNRKLKARSSILLGPVTGTIPFDPTFGSFTLLELVSHQVNQFLWWKCLDCLHWNRCFFGVQSVDTVGRCTTSSYLLAGPACLWRLVFRNACPEILSAVRCPPTTLQKSYKVFQDINAGNAFCMKKKKFPWYPLPTAYVIWEFLIFFLITFLPVIYVRKCSRSGVFPKYVPTQGGAEFIWEDPHSEGITNTLCSLFGCIQ
jgi:hypothetical protein